MFFGCDSKRQIDSKHFHNVNVDLSSNIELKFSDFFDTTLIVPLEETPNSLIGQVSKVLTTDDYIYLLDSYVAESLYVFDYQGNFVRYFGSTGSGPGEFLRVSNFFLSPNADTVFVTDYSLSKFLAFSPLGELFYEKKFDVGEIIYDLVPFEGNYLVSRAYSDSLTIHFQHIDGTLEEVYQEFDLVENNFIQNGGFKPQYIYPSSGESIYFKEELSQNFYEFHKNALEIYSFRFPENKVFSPNDLPWSQQKPRLHLAEVYSEIRKRDLYSLGDQILEIDSLILMTLHEGRNISLLAFNKYKKTAKKVNKFVNDLDGVIPDLPGIFENYQAGEMLVFLTPSDIYSSINKNGGPTNLYQRDLMNKADSMGENPVLFLYRKK